jgi:chemotaxis regulatin CheY-phosphate phosphatase CheZ
MFAKPAPGTPAPAPAASRPAPPPAAGWRNVLVDRHADVATKVAAVLTPACTETLPAVTFTITGIIQATEVAAQKVLDEVDRMVAARNDLCVALGALDPFVGVGPEAGAACATVIEALRALSARIEPIVGAMEFQDLTAQHLRATMDAVQGLRDQLLDVLHGLDVPVAGEAAPVKITAKIGAPASSSPWRQALADQLRSARAPAPTRAE